MYKLELKIIDKNARLEILVDLPPAAVGEAQPMVFGQTPNIWTCLPPAADGAGSRIACATTSPMVQPEFPSYTYGFMLRYTPPYRAGLDSYTVTTRVLASSDSEEQAPDDNLGEASFTVDQTTDLAIYTYTLTDGQKGDNDWTVNGVIEDPVGLGVAAAGGAA